MCGLAGLVSNEINEEERHVIVSRMMQYIENRGPDEKGIYSYKESTFGFARLSIREIKTVNNKSKDFLVSKFDLINTWQGILLYFFILVLTIFVLKRYFILNVNVIEIQTIENQIIDK